MAAAAADDDDDDEEDEDLAMARGEEGRRTLCRAASELQRLGFSWRWSRRAASAIARSLHSEGMLLSSRFLRRRRRR
jgi:hypothetical protein